jgi:isopenicillin N synthase-like dioxygenase
VKQVPVINFSVILSVDTSTRAETVRRVHDACATIGFFYITGHGIPQSLIDDTFAASREFFAIPDGQKTDARLNAIFRGHKPLDMKGGFEGKRQVGGAELFTAGLDVPADDPLTNQPGYGPTPWPAAMPGFQRRVTTYFDTVSAVCAKVVAVLAQSLEIDPRFFESKYAKPTSTCVLNHYPPLPDDAPPGTFSGQEHTDWGSLTMLYQDSCGGLQVKTRDGEWIEAPPIEGAYVLNIGDMLQRWSNDRFVSTPHRIINRSGKERYSIGVFYNPQSDAVVDPRELGVTAEECKHEPIAAGAYIASRWADYYGAQHSAA